MQLREWSTSSHKRSSLCYAHVISYFNYCSLVRHFGNLKNIHDYDDYETDYFQILREKTLCSLYKERLRGLLGISSAYVNYLLLERPSNYHSRQDLNLYVSRINLITYGYKSFTLIAPKIWISIPMSIRESDTYKSFQLNIKKITLPWCVCENCCLKQGI